MRPDPRTDPLDTVLRLAHEHGEVLMYRVHRGEPVMSLVRRECFEFLGEEKNAAGGIRE